VSGNKVGEATTAGTGEAPSSSFSYTALIGSEQNATKDTSCGVIEDDIGDLDDSSRQVAVNMPLRQEVA